MLRGLAILEAILFHLWNFNTGSIYFTPSHATLIKRLGTQISDFDVLGTITATSDLIFRSGADGVISWFFMMSGLWLTYSALSNNRPVPAIPFYLGRPMRLLRAYWVGVAIVLAFLVVFAVPKMMMDDVSFEHAVTRLGPLKYFDRGSLTASILFVPRGFKFEWAFAIPSSFWFAFLLMQFYLLHPWFLRIGRTFGFGWLLAGSVLTSLAAAASLILVTGDFERHAWVPALWFPFRLLDHVFGMVLAYLLLTYRSTLERIATGPVAALWTAGGLAIYLFGSASVTGGGYQPVLVYPLVAIGLACFSLPLLIRAPRRVEASLPGRILTWIGPMSLTVIIMNEPFRFIDQYLWVQGVSRSAGWWLYVIAVYVPGTLVLAALLARALGLTPPEHMLSVLRSGRARAGVQQPAEAVRT
jgi:peptidoglycan/LPS O-acetylase OafA/YrhL